MGTALHQPQLQQLHSKEVTSKPFPPKTTTSTTTQSKWAAAATPTAPARAAPALRAPAPAAISKSFHQRTFGSIIRQHHNVTASPRRSPLSSQHGNHVNGLSARVTRHHGLQEWIEGQIDEDTRLKMEGKETSVTEMHFRFYLLLMNPEDFRS